MPCKECKNMAITSMEDVGYHHHLNCPRAGVDKYPHYFVYSEAVDGWVLAEKIHDKWRDQHLLDISDAGLVEDGDTTQIKLRYLTDVEWANLSED